MSSKYSSPLMAGFSTSGGNTIATRNLYIPMKISVAQGTTGRPLIDNMTTTISKKVSGWILPDGANSTTLNLKCFVPDSLASSPASAVLLVIKTQGAVTNADVVLEYQDKHLADGEDADFTSWTNDTGEVEYRMPNSDDTISLETVSLTTQPTAEDFIMAQVIRNPAASGPPTDDYTADIQLVEAYFRISVTSSLS